MRRCKICRVDLSVYGMTGGICPDCQKEKRKIMMFCAGTCKREHLISLMDKIKVITNPSKKGSRTVTLYYCSSCFSSAKSRMIDRAKKQEDVIKSAELQIRKNGSVRRDG